MAEACASDEALRHDVEKLLAVEDIADSLLAVLNWMAEMMK